MVTTYSTRVRAPTNSAVSRPQQHDAAILKSSSEERIEVEDGCSLLQTKKNLYEKAKNITKIKTKKMGTGTDGKNLRRGNMIRNKKPLRIATWNVRTLNGESKLDELCSAAREYHLDAIAVTETHLIDKFESKVGGYTFFNSGETTIKRNGVGLLLSPLLADNLASLEQHSSRIITARIYMRHVNLSIICCYAPTNEASDTAKNTFYRKLEKIIKDTPRHDVKLLLGDFNAKLSNDNHGFQGILGQHSLHSATNDNGERLLELCMSHNLTIGSTMFPHKDIHKYTWTHPNGVVRNQIDHVCISRTWSKSLLDVRTQRGANIGSDHELVLSKLQLKLSRNSRSKPTKRYNTNLLQDKDCTTRYQLEVRNRFEALPTDESLDVNGSWDRISKVLKESAEVTIGFKKPVKDRWISTQTKDLMAKRGKAGAHRKGRTYHSLCKEVKKSVKEDQDRWYSEQATMMEDARQRNDTRTVYQCIGRISGKGQKSAVNVKNEGGKLLTSKMDKLKRWKDYFSGLLNKTLTDPEKRERLRNTNIQHPPMALSEEPPSREEIDLAISKMKKYKAPGPDNIQAELIRYGGVTLLDELVHLYQRIWEEEKIPDEWRKGIITIVPKAGDLSVCSNNRGITLLSVALKILNRVLISRITPGLEQILRDNQAGFRHGRSCCEQIFVVRQLFERCKEFSSHPIFACFVDYKAAFDSVDRTILWEALALYGIPVKYVNLIKEGYDGFTAQVNVGGSLTDPFVVEGGVKQGDVPSPTLFNIMIDLVATLSYDSPESESLGMFISSMEGFLTDREFADDNITVAESEEKLQKLIDNLIYFSDGANLSVNTLKTKIMSNRSDANIVVNGTPLEVVPHYKYLGSYVNPESTLDKELNVRIGKAWGQFNKLEKVWNSGASITTKMRIYQTSIRSTMTYACETWALSAKQEKKLDATDRKIIRRILKVRWFKKQTNEELYRITKLRPLSSFITKMRLKWLGHVLRFEDNNVVKQLLFWQPNGSNRPVGRPIFRFSDTIRKDAQFCGIDAAMGSLANLAQDRMNWRRIVAAAMDRCP